MNCTSQVRGYDVIVVKCTNYRRIVEILTNKIDCYAHFVSISRICAIYFAWCTLILVNSTDLYSQSHERVAQEPTCSFSCDATRSGAISCEATRCDALRPKMSCECFHATRNGAMRREATRCARWENGLNSNVNATI